MEIMGSGFKVSKTERVNRSCWFSMGMAGMLFLASIRKIN